MTLVEAQRPGVAPAPARPGLPGDAGGPAAGKGLHQHGGDQGGGAGVQHARALRGRRRGAEAQGGGAPALGEGGIEPDYLAQRRPEAAERERQRGVRARGQARRRARGLERGGVAEGAEFRQQRHRGQVQRLPQRVRHGDAAREAAVVVLRRVGAEAARQVGQHRLRRGDARLEGQGVEDGLQRGARRPDGARQVQRPRAVLVAMGAADQGPDLARRQVGDEDPGHAGRDREERRDLGDRLDFPAEVADPLMLGQLALHLVRLRGGVHQRLDGELVTGPGAAARHGVRAHQRAVLGLLHRGSPPRLPSLAAGNPWTPAPARSPSPGRICQASSRS